MTNILLACIGVMGFLYLLSVIGYPFYHDKGKFKWFYHDIMHWHRPDAGSKTIFDGCSVHAKCADCGKEIMQDSQGNWF